ncbi:MAG: hypothetical protein EXS37_09130 [Opitutus sp.]|nr:hypothetical protein [Opitutus sp.]
MPEETDPPRKHYQLKPREFEAVNGPPRGLPPTPETAVAPAMGPGEADNGRIDVRDLFKKANQPGPALSAKARPAADNEIHVMLRENVAHANAAGLNTVAPARKFHRRKRDFVVLVIAGNGFIAVIYSVEMFIGFQVQCLAARLPFEFWNLVWYAITHPATYALPLAGMVFFTIAVAWLLFGVIDDY